MTHSVTSFPGALAHSTTLPGPSLRQENEKVGEIPQEQFESKNCSAKNQLIGSFHVVTTGFNKKNHK